MTVQIIARDGAPEYAVLPWDEYQALLQAAGQEPAVVVESVAASAAPERPALSELASRREARGVSAEELARLVGISPHYLAMIERGERVPDAAILRSLAWQLGLEGWS